MQNDITMVITSCDRAELLARSLHSLHNFSLDGIREIIIIEDSNSTETIEAIVPDISDVPVRFVQNEENIGLLPSVDRAYAMVTTPYIFHSEDDWLYGGGLYLEASRQILDECQDVSAVMIRAPWSLSMDKFARRLEETSAEPKARFWRNPFNNKSFGHFSFNPGLRRLSDYQKLGNYSEKFLNEEQISAYYRSQKMRLAYLLRGDAIHIGVRQSAIKKRPETNILPDMLKKRK